jgi:hypothetical protein
MTETGGDLLDRFALIRPRGRPLRPLRFSTEATAESRVGGRPGDVCVFELRAQQPLRRLLLLLQRPPRVAVEPVGGGKQEPNRDLRPVRVGEKAVDVGLGDLVGLVVALRLDRPDGAVMLDRDQVGAKVGGSVLPLAIGDDPVEAVTVAGVVAEEPLANVALELGAPLVRV